MEDPDYLFKKQQLFETMRLYYERVLQIREDILDESKKKKYFVGKAFVTFKSINMSIVAEKIFANSSFSNEDLVAFRAAEPETYVWKNFKQMTVRLNLIRFFIVILAAFFVCASFVIILLIKYKESEYTN